MRTGEVALVGAGEGQVVGAKGASASADGSDLAAAVGIGGGNGRGHEIGSDGANPVDRI
jgi:hypothetical protein